jgi:hypothetical protein
LLLQEQINRQVSLSVPTLFEFPFALFPPLAPFFDGFFSQFRRTRRLEIKSGISCVAQTHLGEKARLQIFALQQINQFGNRILRHPAPLFGKFLLLHKS